MAFLHEKSCNTPSKSNLQLRSTFIFTTSFKCLQKIPRKKAKLTPWVSLVIYLWKTERSMRSSSILSRRFYLKGDIMKLYPFIQGSLEWPFSELFSANVSLWNQYKYITFNAFSCGILNISYKILIITVIFNEKTNKSTKYGVLCRNVITFYRQELPSLF